MPITEDDLRALLAERSEGLTVPLDRLARVHRLIDRRRHRVQATAVAAVLVAAGAVAAGLGLAGTPSEAPPPAVHPSSPRLPAYAYGGRLLVGAAMHSPREGSVTVRFTPTDWQFMVWVGAPAWRGTGSMLVGTLNGHLLGEGLENGTGVLGAIHGQEQQHWSSLGVRLGQPSTVTLTVVSGEPGRKPLPMPPVMQRAQDRPTGTVTLGVYQPVPYADYPLPAPPPTLHPLQPFRDGGVRLDSRRVGPNGQWQLTTTVGSGSEVIVRTVAPGRIRLLVGGHEVDYYESWDYADAGGDAVLDAATLRSYGVRARNGQAITLTVIADRFAVPGWTVQAEDYSP